MEVAETLLVGVTAIVVLVVAGREVEDEWVSRPSKSTTPLGPSEPLGSPGSSYHVPDGRAPESETGSVVAVLSSHLRTESDPPSSAALARVPNEVTTEAARTTTATRRASGGLMRCRKLANARAFPMRSSTSARSAGNITTPAIKTANTAALEAPAINAASKTSRPILAPFLGGNASAQLRHQQRNVLLRLRDCL